MNTSIDSESLNSTFGDHSPYSDDGQTNLGISNITHKRNRNLSATNQEPNIEENKGEHTHNSSSDTANFFQNFRTDLDSYSLNNSESNDLHRMEIDRINLSFDNDSIVDPRPNRNLMEIERIIQDNNDEMHFLHPPLRNSSYRYMSTNLSENSVNTEIRYPNHVELPSMNENPPPRLPVQNNSHQNLNMYSEGTSTISSVSLGEFSNINRMLNNYLNRNHFSFQQQVEEIMESFNYVVTSQAINLKEEKKKMAKEQSNFNTFIRGQKDKLDKEKIEWEKNLKAAEEMYCQESDVIELDIGGTSKIITTRATLTKKHTNSALAAMFSGRHKLALHKGRIFIDRDSEAFNLLMSYLRNDKIPYFSSKVQENLFFEELDYWQIQINLNESDKNVPIPQFDMNWCASTLKVESDNLVVRKHGLQHGVVFIKSPLDKERPYIEFKVTINIPSRGKSHLFVGVVDKSKYRQEHLTSSFWKDSPSSFWWDIWSTKLIKTDENGNQTGVVTDYGCFCEPSTETNIGIEYSEENKALTFYKNGINQGTAFHFVQPGLFPALDIWFESGHIQILPKHKYEENQFL